MGSVCCSGGNIEENHRLVNKELDKDRRNDKTMKKLLLLGAGSSGKTTFFKQLKRIHNNGFTYKDRRDFQAQINNQLIEQMQKLIMRGKELMEDFEDEYNHLEVESPETLDSVAYVEHLRRDNAITDEVAYHIGTLWNDAGIRNTFAMRAKLCIPDSCDHFFNHVKRIAAADYLPTDEDILLVRKRTTGIIEESFEIKGTKFHILDVGGQRNERKKWIHCFENVTAVIFVASLSSYDEVLLEDENIIVMHETLNLFDEICNSRWFVDTSIILFLNKRDLFEVKLQTIPINECFKNYLGSREFEPCQQFIQLQFENKSENPSKDIFSHVTCATDRDNVDRVFNDVQHVVVSSNLHTGGLV